MPKARGDQLKARIEAAAADGCALLAGRIRALGGAAGQGPGRAALGVVKDGIGAAATALGVTPAELGARLRSGDTLKDVATDKGVPYDTVSAAVIAAVKADLDAAVTAGTIKQAREDRILERLGRNLADGRLRAVQPAAPAAPLDGTRAGQLTARQSKTTTWRSPSPARSRSKAPSRSSSPIRRSMRRSIGSRPARWRAA